MSKISELSNGGALLPTDDLIVVRSGGNVRAQLSAISGQSVSATTLSASGATTLSSTLTVNGDASISSANARLRLFETDTTNLNTQIQNQAGDFKISRLDDDAGGSTVQLTIDHATGHVGIGTSSPKSLLDIASDEQSIITLSGTTNNTAGALLGGINFYNADGSTNGPNNAASIKAVASTTIGADADLIFSTLPGATSGADALEVMRLVSSGNLLVGKTASDAATPGHELKADGAAWHTADGTFPLFLNRETDDGELIRFRKDNSDVGSIGIISGDRMYFSTSDGLGLQLDKDNNRIIPCDADGSYNSSVSLGSSGLEFKNLYVKSGGSNAGTFKAVGGYALQAYQDATSADHTALDLRSDHVSGGTDRYLIRGYNTAAGTPIESFNVNTAGGAMFSGNLLVGRTAVPVGVLSGRQLVNSSPTGAEIIAYRDDNGVVSGDFCGAHLIGNDDNSGTPDHFCGMWATASSATGAMNLKFASQLGGYESGTYDMQISASGSVNIAGALSKGSGSFRIDHPLPAKTETHDLVHSFVEAPQADNIYRGKVDLVGGSATVNIDTVAGMTEGTYVLLNTNTQCFTSNESGWTAVKGSVSGNTLTITAQESCTDTISWMVVGERKDQHMIDTDWTDDNGKVIVEPLKENN